jgi:DNA/RNA-binding domain of Phe-tRNA-synthetase-like protein
MPTGWNVLVHLPWHGSLGVVARVSIVLSVEPHPLLALEAFETRFPAGLASPSWLVELLALDATAPIARHEELRAAARDLLRHGGYKPTGRGKPASEYLVREASERSLPSINLAVDACNVVSLHSGIPISVVDLDRCTPPLRVAIVRGDERYVFNQAGHEIRLEGLLCLHDAAGPCANAVKDSQRTKTRAETVRTLSLLWGPTAFAAETRAAAAWYRELLERAGARTAPA